ncbi:putative Dol-P-Man:Man(5)GlcNAc(2)-PP-Dol alpha-1,3-mannosyltransferase [Grifola frondosa]|uniref:Dol-P-Man:Man(5)GlcNAc(2)-PP-Dol alpha-1,3-mannosyltransferase n=1 Tax=Grifola frondosa TaxID=5627 RepID=A0A1C7MHW7_GRIFR|nr:putative Dol-P-Man:Man(5)GlcNAc(2)-PP-Dol alpha-1,3-mannosyltransferase [Grifola frondosa]
MSSVFTYRLNQLWHLGWSLLSDPKYFLALAALVILGDALLTQLVIRFVPYTEIDWETYMYQLELYLKGERDYSLISGPTGPIVYPAGHIYVHRFLYTVTNSGTNLPAAQQVYAALYLASTILTCAIYRQAGGVPNWVLLLLPLSKRLHSIYVLRLFNDCWTAVASQAAILAFGRGWDALGILLFSCAISVKMSALLYVPGLLVILFRRNGLLSTLAYMLVLVISQVAIGLPFLLEHPQSYLKHAYEFSRAFLFKWTVNWRFVGEETFLSPRWALTLLAGHVVVLVAFGLYKWCRSDGGVWAVLDRGFRRPTRPAWITPLTPDYVTTVLFTSNLIGILFARSLHYQFYSWYAQQLPFLAWRTKFPVPIRLMILLGIEYAWNVFPSTSFSSGLLCVANAVLLAGVWFGYPEGKRDRSGSIKTG